MVVEHAQQAPGFGDVAVARALVLVFPAGELVEEAELAEHRADAAHLEHHPLDGLIARGRIRGQQLAGLLGQVQQDRAGFEQGERLAARAVRIEDGRNLVVRIQRQEFRRQLIVGVEPHQVRLIGEPDFLQHDRRLDAVGRRQRIELKPVGMLGGPFAGDRVSGKIGHGSLGWA